MYQVTDDLVQPRSFSDAVPSRTNAGTYYVWYFVQGTSGTYTDSDIKYIEVTIDKKTTTLTNEVAPTAVSGTLTASNITSQTLFIPGSSTMPEGVQEIRYYVFKASDTSSTTSHRRNSFP